MRYCLRCLYSENHPLGLLIDAEGICSGCRVHEEKDLLAWDERWTMLEKLVEPYRNRNSLFYDCVVPVNGSRDSLFIVHTVKRYLGLNPLLVTYNKHYNTEAGFHNLSKLRTMLNSDIMIMSSDPRSIRKINRETLRLRGSMYWHALAGETVFPVQTAVRFRIPLVIWGAHQGVDQVGMFSHLNCVEMTRKYRKEHDLMGLEAEDLLHESEGRLNEKDIDPFIYPSNLELASVGVRGIYLNNYIRWDTKAQHENMREIYGEISQEQQRTFDPYNDVDSFHFNGIHDHIKFLKWGYGRATDHAVREIRLKRLTRRQGINLVARYQHRSPQDIKLFLDWMGLDESEFYSLVNSHRDPRIWSKEKGQWKLLDEVSHHINDDGVDSAKLDVRENCEFTEDTPSELRLGKYVTIGRGWQDRDKLSGIGN